MGKTNYGKGAPEHLNHVTTRRVTNAAGFSNQKSLGPDTSPGAGPGAPFHDVDAKDESDVRRTSYPRGGNPYNPHDTDDTKGVVLDLGKDTPNGPAGVDSPVPTKATRPHPNIAELGAQHASAVPGTMDRFPADGVLGKT